MTIRVEDPVHGESGADHDAVWARLTGQLKWYSENATRAQNRYKRVKLGQIVVGAALPVVAALSAPAVVTASIAAAVVAAEGALQLYQWQSNWIRYRATAEALKREKYLFLAKTGPYRDTGRRRVLADRTEAILAAENASWTAVHEETDKPAQ
ncbi:DUF4231 domain-containing protein [Nocardia asteroides]|uniref:DUF4231 domain-containing protein n=1 Tax=Nocardia asteroides TaxID=1824 RepID=UPI0036516CFA